MLPEKADDFNSALADLCGQVDFQGQKLVELQPIDKKWYQTFRKVHTSFFTFIKSSFPAILKWQGQEVAAEQIFTKNLASLGGAPTPAAAPKEEAKQPAPAETKSAPAKPVAAKKAPERKQTGFKTWEVSNFVNDTIEFTAEQVQPGMTINIFNCEGSTIKIAGKCKNIMMSKCKKCEFFIEEVMSLVEVMKCDDSKIYALKCIPRVSVQTCNTVQVIATLESKARLSVETTTS